MENINWEALQAILELLGLIAVVASLIFVGLQLQRNSEEIRSSSYHGATDSFNSWNLALIGDSGLSEIWLKGQKSYDDLSDEEVVKFGFLLRAVFRICDTVYYQSRHGTGDTSLWECERKNVEVLFSTPDCRAWWRDHPYGFSAAFSRYIEDNILSKQADENSI